MKIARVLFSTIALLCVSLFSSPTPATQLVSFDGTWWTSLTDDEQVTAIEGLLGGYQAGFNNGYIRALSNDRYHYHSTRTDAQAVGDPDSHQYFSKTFGVYQQEVTDFYSQHPSSTDVLVGDVMACLSDKPQFTCDSVAKFH